MRPQLAFSQADAQRLEAALGLPGARLGPGQTVPAPASASSKLIVERAAAEQDRRRRGADASPIARTVTWLVGIPGTTGLPSPTSTWRWGDRIPHGNARANMGGAARCLLRTAPGLRR